MCDYSLHLVASRTAQVGERLVATKFPGTLTRGFSAIGEPNVAVCLLPGTEIAFDDEPEYGHLFRRLCAALPGRKLGKVSRVQQINVEQPTMHHDALEFPSGKTVLITHLRRGQHATVLQLPPRRGDESGMPTESPPAVELLSASQF